MYFFYALSVCIAMFTLPLGGCGTGEQDIGIAARVNGHPIYLKRLEADYEIPGPVSQETGMPDVSEVKSKYSGILNKLIVFEMVRQELEKKGQAVTDEELEAAERKIRADYPPGAFDRILVERYIDIKYWREQLKDRLNMEKFFKYVLRPDIKLDHKEAETYYKEHINEFSLPARLKFIQIQGDNESDVRKALVRIAKEKDQDWRKKSFPGVEVKESLSRIELLQESRRQALNGLNEGESSKVYQEKNGYFAVVFLEKIPPRVQDAASAYPQVESALLEIKLHEAFRSWLSRTLPETRISVNPILKIQDGNLLKQEEKQPSANGTLVVPLDVKSAK